MNSNHSSVDTILSAVLVISMMLGGAALVVTQVVQAVAA